MADGAAQDSMAAMQAAFIKQNQVLNETVHQLQEVKASQERVAKKAKREEASASKKGSHRGINAATLDTPQRRAAITSRNNALRCGAKRPQLNERQTQQKSRTQRFPFLAMFAFSACPWAVDSENRFVHRE